MSITLAVGPVTVELPDDLYWADELEWSPVEQSVELGTMGALMVDTMEAQAGREITLVPEDDASGWISRANLEQLYAWASVAGQEMTLTLRGVARTVLFRHQDKPVIEKRPIVHYTDVVPEDQYTATFKFMEV
jgi:hypothetical protein